MEPRLTPRRLLTGDRLARLAADGDSRAFEVIFERYHQELYRYCRAILSDAVDAQDALQNTMAAALRNLPGERREIALRPWLYRVAHNEAISIARMRNASPAALEGNPHAAPGADLEIEDRERLRELVADLGALPDRQRGALVMRELSGLSYGEIATALASSEGAARQIVYEARESMRESARGRGMECESVREAISARDGRMLRSRALRAHLRICEPCEDFRAGISQRRSDLQLIAPALPALTASGLLAGVLGHAGAGAGGIGAGGGAMAGGTAVGLSKGTALVAAAVIGAGAVGVTSGVDLPVLGGDEREAAAPPAQPTQASPATSQGQGVHGGDAGAQGERRSGAGAGGQGGGHRSASRNDPGPPNRSGASDTPAGANGSGHGVPAGGSDAVTGPPAQANGNGPPASAGTGTGSAGGNAGTSPGASESSSRSEAGALHSNAGGARPTGHAGHEGARPLDD